MEIKHSDYENKGAFKAVDELQKTAGEMTYSWAGDSKFIIDHTEVNPAFKGQNVGKQLVMAAVNFAREKNVKIMPLCPFAKHVFETDSDIKDVLL